MKLMVLLPLAYIAGEHGFAMFAPYLAVFAAAAYLLQRRTSRAVVVTVAVPARQIAATFSFQK